MIITSSNLSRPNLNIFLTTPRLIFTLINRVQQGRSKNLPTKLNPLDMCFIIQWDVHNTLDPKQVLQTDQ